MKATAWNNGAHHPTGGGYGLKLKAADRDAFFDRSWREAVLVIGEGTDMIEIAVNVDKKSFWDPRCKELINQEIGRWLIAKGLAHWRKYHPPVIDLIPLGGNRFRVS